MKYTLTNIKDIFINNACNIILLITICFNCYKIGEINGNIKTKTREEIKYEINYKTGKVKKHYIKIQKQFAGKVISPKSTVLKTNIQGIIKSIAVEGEVVKCGDVIIQLEDKDAKCTLDITEAMYVFRKKELQNNEELLEKNFISDSEYDKSLCEFKKAEGEYNQALARYEMHKIKAPFDGKVSLQKQTAGSIVNSNIELVTISSNEDYEVIFSVPSSFSKEIDFNNCIYEIITSKGTVEGKFYCIDNEVNTRTNSISIKLKISNSEENDFNINDSFNVMLTYGKKSNVKIVNKEAVFYIQEKAYLIKLLKVKDNKYACVKQEIKIGEKNNLYVEIISDIEQDAMVLLDNQYNIYDNQIIGITE